MTLPPFLHPPWKTVQLAVAPVIIVAVTVSMGFLFHLRGERVVENQLREHMLTMVRLASMQFTADEIRAIQTPEDMGGPVFRTVAERLNTIRDSSPHVRFAYIMRRGDDPENLLFVADADVILTDARLDYDKSGVVEENELPAMTGDVYEVNGDTFMLEETFRAPVVDPEVTVDQWGRFVSAYAPLRDEQGNAVAIIGIDVLADDFYRMTQQTFSMVAVLLVGLVGTALALYIVTVIRTRHLRTMKVLDDERSALLDLATHQLGVPLATFRWWLEILRERKDAELNEIANEFQQGVDRMDQVIGGIKEANDLQKNAAAWQPSSTAVHAAVTAVVADLRTVYERKKQTIHLEIQDDLHPASIDGKLFAGVVRELLDNASSYSPEGSQMTVRARNVIGGIEVTVEDHGYGIPPKDIAHVFEKFRRASNAAQYRPVGNGLGLYIVKTIVDRARGSVRVASTPGKGTVFTVRLPSA